MVIRSLFSVYRTFQFYAVEFGQYQDSIAVLEDTERYLFSVDKSRRTHGVTNKFES